MTEFIAVIGPLLAMMLIPLWIPMIAVAGGAAFDAVTPDRPDPLEQRRRARAARAASANLPTAD